MTGGIRRDGVATEVFWQLFLPAPVLHWGLEYAIEGALEVHCKGCRTKGGLTVELSVSGQLKIPCSRCLEITTLAIFGDLRYLFLLRSLISEQDTQEELSEGEEEIVPLDAWEDELNIAPYIWETLIVSLPVGALCKEDCAGLCPQCGCNKNTGSCDCPVSTGDPRFEVLRQMDYKD